jgi:hypothetical protein
MSDQPPAQATTYTTNTQDKHPCLQEDSNPPSQKSSGFRSYVLDCMATGIGDLLNHSYSYYILWSHASVLSNDQATSWTVWSSIFREAKDFSHLQNMQTDPGAHPASYSMGNRHSFSRSKAVGI